MSRIAKAPIILPVDVEVNCKGQIISIKGKNGELIQAIHEVVKVQHTNNQLTLIPNKKNINSWAIAGTMRALLNNMVIGVSQGFMKKLQLIGVGYRATVINNVVQLFLGYSHLINHTLPTGIIAQCPNQTEIILKGANKQMIGQVAADLRSYRRPEPYKGKGIRYAEEIIRTKETKKK